MVQFYFLSILFNILAGLILVYGRNLTVAESEDYGFDDGFGDDGDSGDDDPFSDDSGAAGSRAGMLRDFEGFNNTTFRLVLGVLCVFVGVMKLLSSCDVTFIGDIVPAVAGFLGGISLLVEYYAASSGNGDAVPANVQNVFIDSRKYIGVLCLTAGVLHFILPRVLFL